MPNSRKKLDLTQGARFDGATIALAREVADGIKPKYFGLIDQIGEADAHRVAWWLSETASRNPNLSRLYKHLWKLALVDRLVADGAPPSEVGGASSAAMETLMMGTRVIVPVPANGPAGHAIPDDVPTDHCRMATTATEMAEAIEAFAP